MTQHYRRKDEPVKVGELRAALDQYPDDMELAVIDDLHDDLDTDVTVNLAVNHPGSRPKGRRSWHWVGETPTRPGANVLVIY